MILILAASFFMIFQFFKWLKIKQISFHAKLFLFLKIWYNISDGFYNKINKNVKYYLCCNYYSYIEFAILMLLIPIPEIRLEMPTVSWMQSMHPAWRKGLGSNPSTFPSRGHHLYSWTTFNPTSCGTVVLGGTLLSKTYIS